MMGGPEDIPNFETLPRTLPLFPLASALLLPCGRLPLNIFEPRYLAMTRDAMDGHRMIGMIQPTDADSAEEKPEIYRTGCAGKIVSFSETPDNRYLITLGGICRFNVVEELSATTAYRQALVSFSRFRRDLEEPDVSPVDIERLLVALKAYLTVNEIPIDWDAIGESPEAAMIDSLAMICPFEPSEKQALIEAGDFEERCRVLTALSEMALVQYTQGNDATLQ